MNKACEICGGACCKGIILNGNKIFAGSTDSMYWFGLHGDLTPWGTMLKCKCKRLLDGKCAIYAQRPVACKSFPVGGPICLETIKILCPEKLESIQKAMNGSQA